MLLICPLHVAELLVDGGLGGSHDLSDDVADCSENVLYHLEGRAELFLEEGQDAIDGVTEPLAFVVEQHQGCNEGHDADDDPGDGVCQECRREAPDGADERHERPLCQEEPGLEHLEGRDGLSNDEAHAADDRDEDAQYSEHSTQAEDDEHDDPHELLVVLDPGADLRGDALGLAHKVVDGGEQTVSDRLRDVVDALLQTVIPLRLRLVDRGGHSLGDIRARAEGVVHPEDVVLQLARLAVHEVDEGDGLSVAECFLQLHLFSRVHGLPELALENLQDLRHG